MMDLLSGMFSQTFTPCLMCITADRESGQGGLCLGLGGSGVCLQGLCEVALVFEGVEEEHPRVHG